MGPPDLSNAFPVVSRGRNLHSLTHDRDTRVTIYEWIIPCRINYICILCSFTNDDAHDDVHDGDRGDVHDGDDAHGGDGVRDDDDDHDGGDDDDHGGGDVRDGDGVRDGGDDHDDDHGGDGDHGDGHGGDDVLLLHRRVVLHGSKSIRQ
ncbi:hypothetical protein TNCT_588511 [Trichonephila clavata]|uniref:Uncharacterized protein n=1 Tax=Trichonephila clavata TaxID=2740835 RepID=A0A8X6LQS0_TRICU|nr:hypothetical protein TNCT_588511 [Trichonephila clavata]